MNKKLTILIFIVLGCTSESNQNFDDLKKIKVGMNYSQVDSIMTNRPIKIEQSGRDTFMEVYTSHFASSDDYRIFYSLSDSTVVEIGYGH